MFGFHPLTFGTSAMAELSEAECTQVSEEADRLGHPKIIAV